jgi:hypothetical protein
VNDRGFRLAMTHSYRTEVSTKPGQVHLLHLKVVPIGPLISATVNLEPSLPASLSCDPPNILRKGRKIDHNAKLFTCTRSTMSAESIVLNTTAGPSSVSLKEIVPPQVAVTVQLSSNVIVATQRNVTQLLKRKPPTRNSFGLEGDVPCRTGGRIIARVSHGSLASNRFRLRVQAR